MKKVREPAGTVAYEVKNLPQSEIDEVMSCFDMKTTPKDHQARALYLGLAQDTFLFSLDMGLGKTLLGLYLASMHKELSGSVKALVTCPPVVLRQWKKESEKHSKLSVTIVDNSLKNKQEKLEQLKNSTTDITVVSHSWLLSLFRWAATDKKLRESLPEFFAGFDMLITDEAHVIRNPSTKGFKGYRKYFLGIKRRYLMTGTPVGNDYTGVWALYYLLDEGATFGTSYLAFLTTYFTAIDRGRYIKYKIKASMKEEFMLKFWAKNIRWEEAECNDLPGKTFTVLPVPMSAEQTKKYDALLEIAEEEMQENPEFELMKVTSGIGSKESPKLDAVKSLITDICVENQRQFIIWCWMREESDYLLAELTKSFKKLNIKAVKGSCSQQEKDSVLNSWAAGKVDILIANQKSLGIGLDLYEANVCCFFSNNHSLIDRKQAEKRIHRTGQTKHCTYIDIVCENTIDEVNLMMVMRAKNSFTQITRDGDRLDMLRRQRL